MTGKCRARTFRLSLEADELANELHLIQPGKPGMCGAANIALLEEDDICEAARYSHQASIGATKAGDVFDLQIRCCKRLAQRCAEVMQIDAEIEAELSRLGTDDSTLATYMLANRAIRAGWHGRFEEAIERYFPASNVFTTMWIAYFAGRIVRFSSLCSDVASNPTPTSSRRHLDLVEHVEPAWRLSPSRVAVARMICSIAAAIAGRTTQAGKIARGIERRVDPNHDALRRNGGWLYRGSPTGWLGWRGTTVEAASEFSAAWLRRDCEASRSVGRWASRSLYRRPFRALTPRRAGRPSPVSRTGSTPKEIASRRRPERLYDSGPYCECDRQAWVPRPK